MKVADCRLAKLAKPDYRSDWPKLAKTRPHIRLIEVTPHYLQMVTAD